jgi:ferredoxin
MPDRIIVDRSRCSGYGICAQEAPDVFELGDDGLVNLRTEYVPEGQEEAVQAAVTGCPKFVLDLVEDENA